MTAAKMSLAKNFAAAGTAKRTTKKHREKMQAAARRVYAAEVRAQEIMDLAEERAAEPGTVFTLKGTDYRVDRKGRAVRETTRDNQVTREDVEQLLIGNRAVEEDDCLRSLGKGAMKFMLDNDLLRRCTKNSELLFVTVKAARKYDLPNMMGVKGFFTA